MAITETKNIKIGTSNVDIKIGETQVDKVYVGTTLVWEKEEPEPQGETWIINESPNFPFSLTGGITVENISFTSNNEHFSIISINNTRPDPITGSTSNITYGGTWPPNYTNNNGWTDEAYRTITFETSPTGDLLTWLQANAVKQ